MPHIVPIKELRNTNEISEQCHSIKEPIFVTKNGYGDLVVMSMETYESLINTSNVDNAIAESLSDTKNGGQPIEAREALTNLRRKYFK